jgi:acetyltransferase-like isoleucine patch superfamily enzyme
MSSSDSQFIKFRSRGTGAIDRALFRALGEHVIFEHGALAFHPENITIGSNVYVGHYSILSGYYKNEMRIGSDVWIGQHCFLHSAGGLVIEDGVGIGPGVKITSARHCEEGGDGPITAVALEFLPVVLGAGCNIGVGAVILPGVTIGRCAQIGAGAVVTKAIPDNAIASGVPARVSRYRRAGPIA